MDVPAASSVVAIVPLKALAHAKQRLAPALGPAARRELVAWMFDRVIEACRGAAAVDTVLAVCGDGEAEALARQHGVVVLGEDGRGLNAALAAADAWLGDAGAWLGGGGAWLGGAGAWLGDGGASLVVVADLPLVTAADLDAVCAEPGGAPRAGRGVVVAPTDDGGTAVLLRRPARVMPAAFGAGSADAHAQLAAANGLDVRYIRRRGLAVDVDTDEDLAEAARQDPRLHRWARQAERRRQTR